MAAPNISAYTNKYKFGKGRLFFNRLSAGVYQGFRPFGNCPAFNLNIEGERFTHVSSEGGVSTTDLDVPLSIERAGEIQCDNMSNENLALFVSGEVATVTQAATPETDYVIASVVSGSSYLIGANSSRPTGVRGLTVQEVRIKNGDDAAARANTTAYVVGDVYVPAAPNGHWYACTVSGTSAGTPPSFTTDGTTFADGTATFKDMGLIIVASTSNVNYRVDTTSGLLTVEPGGTIATAITALAAVLSTATISLHVDFTPTANTRSQVRTGAVANLQGQLMFISDNPVGDNQDVFLPSVTLSASGELPFITEGEVAVMTIAIGISQLDSNTPSIIIDGRP